MPEENQLAEKTIDLNDPDLLINRELSLLEFQIRVFDEVRDTNNPLLERVKFLSILGSNLDEFFMVRVGGLSMQIDAGIKEVSIDGLTPAEQLAGIRKVAHKLLEDAENYFQQTLLPELNLAGIHILDYSDLSLKQRDTADSYFHEVVFPVLTPLAFDPGHPFPHISNLSLNLAVLIKDEENKKHFARVKVPGSLPQMVPIKRSSGGVRKDGTAPHHHYFVWLSQLITANLSALFPGMEVIEAHPFHIVRNADFEIQELEADDLLETMEVSVRKRRFGSVVRLLVNQDMPVHILDILIENLKVDVKDIYMLDGPLNLRSLMKLTLVDRYDLKYKAFSPSIPPILKISSGQSRGQSNDGSIFSAIRKRNILLHHPYQSFTPVVQFLEKAAKDPNVLAIKQTLYRVGSTSPVVKALLDARRVYGKQVAVLVELKARFDEASNIEWARILEQEGVHVTYGLLGLKTHSKIALVVRKEGENIRRYLHLGTGNYNYITAQFYEDMGMFTCDDEIGADATDLFNYLTGYSTKSDYRKLLVAPINLRSRFQALIQNEIDCHQKSGNGQIIMKMNSLVDKEIIRLLYKASQAGVSIDLIVRGICCLKPGIKGVSENIRVISVLGRFLEHSRIYYFHNAGNEKIYMGSADLMPRNLDRRVEVLFPVESREMIGYIRRQLLNVYLADNLKSRHMKSDGSFVRIEPAKGSERISTQDWLLNYHGYSNWD
ncbi:MAG: polyphosphate kinase 1 [Anaerolineaceae bacterium]|nr:polyphosphate kinase 1 [Anaerolineaceae bacterium]